MSSKACIEVDAETADKLSALAAAREVSVSNLIAELAIDMALSPDLDARRQAVERAWSEEALAEDVAIIAEFEQKRLAVPLDEVKAWSRVGTHRKSCQLRCHVSSDDLHRPPEN